MSLIVEGAVFRISGFTVHAGGEGFHPNYHLKFCIDTSVIRAVAHFPPLTYNLFSHFQIAWRFAISQGFFDLAGFASFCSPVMPSEINGYSDKEFFFVTRSLNSSDDWGKDEVMCYLRGSFVEQVQKHVHDAIERNGVAFMLLCYVIESLPEDGFPCVTSVSNATSCQVRTYLKIISNAQVQCLRRQLINGFYGV